MFWLREHYPEVNRISAEDRAAKNEFGLSFQSLEQARTSKLPDVPILLLTGVNPHDSFTRSVLPRWLTAHQKWLSAYPGSIHVITRKSGHDLPFNEPELVVQAIREIVAEIQAKDLEGPDHQTKDQGRPDIYRRFRPRVENEQ